VYHYLDNTYEFVVDRARALVQDGREPVEVDDESVEASVADSAIDDAHVGHVDPAEPGIIAFIYHRADGGEEVEAHLLIDGHHRAARCLREGRPFFAHLLTPEESRAIVLRSPGRLGNNFNISKPREESDEAGDLHESTTLDYVVKYADSRPWAERSRQVIAGATTHDRRGFGPFGVYVDRADGPFKWDVAGHKLIDLWMGHGALLCGHNFPPVVEAVTRQITRGTHYGASHPLEVRWAELVCELIPSAERVRFTGTGTEATALALRTARAFTGRKRVVKFDGHFHGWHDEAMAHFYDADSAGFNPGAAERVALGDPNDLKTVVRILEAGDVAAVLLEPGGGSAGGLPWSADFLRELRQITQDYGTLLVFDEVITGFRHTPGGVQAATGVTPDLTTLAKILSGGLPGGAVAGRADVMAVFGVGTQRGDRLAKVPHTGTFNANPLSAAAGIALLEHIRDGAPQETAWRAAERLVDGVNDVARAHRVDVRLYTSGTSIYHVLIGAYRAGAPLVASQAVVHLHRAHPKKYALLRRALLVEGVDTHPVHGWISSVHDDTVIDDTVAAFDRVFARLKDAEGFRRP
jgi:glutamate-1-semialdehyde 2,1-aminomutase